MNTLAPDALTFGVTTTHSGGAPVSTCPLSRLVFDLYMADLTIRTSPHHALARQGRATLLQALRGRADAQAWSCAVEALGKAPAQDKSTTPAALSLEQKAMVAAGQYASPIPVSIELGATLNPAAFRRAIHAVVERHPVITTLLDATAAGEVVAFLSDDHLAAWLDERITEARKATPARHSPGASDLLVGPQKSFEFEIRRHGLGYRADFSFHPLVFDENSALLFTKAFGRAYGGGHFATDAMETSQPDQTPLTFFDYSNWQLLAFTPDLRQALDAYWAEWIKTAPILVHPRTAQPLEASGPGTTRRLPLSAPIGPLLRNQARKLGVAATDLFAALVATAIFDWSGASRLTVLREADLRSPRLKGAIGPLSGLDPIVLYAPRGGDLADLARQVMVEGLLSRQLRRPDDGTAWPASPSRLRDLAPVLISSRRLPAMPAGPPPRRQPLTQIEIEHVETSAGDEVRLHLACASLSAADREALAGALTRVMPMMGEPRLGSHSK